LPNFILPYSGIINDLDIEVAKNIKGFAVIPDLSKLMKDNIAKTYSHNLNLYIKNFSQEEVFKLRREVEKNLYTGFRREQLVELIKDRYAVTQRKAKFLAKQETNLLLSEFTAERYKDAGVKKFQWTKSSSKVPDEYHKTLYGKVFSFDDLPVIDEKICQKGLPRQRYNCSCGMRAVLETND
jgi:SPP1 gp7 family putative phage head morphogenesis protein